MPRPKHAMKGSAAESLNRPSQSQAPAPRPSASSSESPPPAPGKKRRRRKANRANRTEEPKEEPKLKDPYTLAKERDLLCSRPGCPYAVSKYEMMGSFCCKRCSAGWKGHGQFCEKRELPLQSARAPRSDPDDPLHTSKAELKRLRKLQEELDDSDWSESFAETTSKACEPAPGSETSEPPPASSAKSSAPKEEKTSKSAAPKEEKTRKRGRGDFTYSRMPPPRDD